MSENTDSLKLDTKRLSEGARAILAAKALAQMAQPGNLEIIPSAPGHDVVEWLNRDMTANTKFAWILYGEIAMLAPLTEARDTGPQQFLPHEPADWQAISRETGQLQQAKTLIPSAEIRELAKRLVAQDYSRDDIKEWAKRLSQLPFSDEE